MDSNAEVGSFNLSFCKQLKSNWKAILTFATSIFTATYHPPTRCCWFEIGGNSSKLPKEQVSVPSPVSPSKNPLPKGAIQSPEGIGGGGVGWRWQSSDSASELNSLKVTVLQTCLTDQDIGVWLTVDYLILFNTMVKLWVILNLLCLNTRVKTIGMANGHGHTPAAGWCVSFSSEEPVLQPWLHYQLLKSTTQISVPGISW